MIETVPETGSTNADLLARLRAGDLVPEGYWLVADRQTGGRGRQGRSWRDAPGNFMGSTVVQLQPPHDPPAATLSFVAALAVYEAVCPLLAAPGALRLKWPNDLLLDGAKLCGLLLEREGDAIVIGIGVNLAKAPQVEGRAVTAIGTGGDTPSRDVFARLLAAQMALALERWRQFGTAWVFDRWQALAHAPGTPMTVHQPDGQPLAGTFAGLADDGALRLRLVDGSTRIIHAGDVMLENG